MIIYPFSSGKPSTYINLLLFSLQVQSGEITATQELHELATKKGLQAKFRFLEPPNFEFKSAMRLWSKDEMRGNYRVQLSINGYEYFGQADLPQQVSKSHARIPTNYKLLAVLCDGLKLFYGLIGCSCARTKTNTNPKTKVFVRAG